MPKHSPTQIVIKPTLNKVKAIYIKRMKKLSDLTTPFKKVSIFLDTWVQRNFKTQGGKVGKWDPIYREGMILQYSGRLKSSFLPFANKKNAGIGSNLPYSKKHNEGIGVKERRMLPEKPEVMSDARKILEKHVEVTLND